MDNMIPSTKTTVKSRKQVKRGEDIVQGWESYYKIACKIAWKWNAQWFPTRDDLSQAAALAASVAFNEIGEQAEYRELCRLLNRVLYSQTAAYGCRKVKITKEDGRRVQIRANREVSYTQLVQSQREETASNAGEYLERRMMIVGVGEYTRKHAYFLHDLLH